MASRCLSTLLVVMAAGSAWSQAPDVRVRLDAVVSLSNESGGRTKVRTVDPLGNRGVLAITFFLEPGFRTYLTQRLQQIRNDPDKQPLDEYYVEDTGIWRIGKQYLPFGSGNILRESVLAARGDTNLILEGLPVIVAACDGGEGLQRGVVGRLGSRIGVSVAFGHHFGISPTTLAYIRGLEDSPGRGRGYQQVFGLDGSRTFGRFVVRGEAVAFRVGETPEDEDVSVVDGSVTMKIARESHVTAGVTRSIGQGENYYRLHASLPMDTHMTLEPLLRMRDGRFWDASLNIRIRF